MVGQKTISA